MLEEIHDSFWAMSKTSQIPAPASKVWETIASPGNLESCHPFVERNPVEQWPGVGSKDVIYYYSGLTYHRVFYAWEDGVGYDLNIGKKGNLSSKVFWRVRSSGEDRSSLTITVRPLDPTGWMKLTHWVPVLVFYRPLLDKYLNSVVSGFRYFITTGKPVSRNQFGSLKIFSPPE